MNKNTKEKNQLEPSLIFWKHNHDFYLSKKYDNTYFIYEVVNIKFNELGIQYENLIPIKGVYAFSNNGIYQKNRLLEIIQKYKNERK